MKRINSLIVVDLIGTLAVGACLAVGLWCGLIDAAATSDQIHRLADETAQLDETLGKLKAALQRQREELDHRQAAFGARDLLPDSTPVERELRAVSELAQQHGLELADFTLLGDTRYPGVREQRFQMTFAGSFAGHLGFLRAFEAGDSWADVTYLKLSGVNAQAPDGRTGEFTISLYSAEKLNPTDKATQ